MNLIGGGNWRSVPLHAVFDVADGEGNPLGTIAANPTQEQAQAGMATVLQIPQGLVMLMPREETLPQGYHFEARYAAQTGAGLNTVTLLAYQAEGLFALQHSFEDGTPAANGQFALVDQAGNQVTAFACDSAGVYTAGQSLPAGEYALVNTQEAQNALPVESQSVQIPVYMGQQIPQFQVTAKKAPVDQTALGAVTLACHDAPLSLYEGEQTWQAVIEDGVNGANTWPLTEYTLTLGGLEILDRQGVKIKDQTPVYFSGLKYEAADSAYQVLVQPLYGNGAAAGMPVLLKRGETYQNSDPQVQELAVTYQDTDGHPLVQPGFHGGKLTAWVTAQGRTPQFNAPEAAGIRLAARGEYQVVYPAAQGTTVLAGRSADGETLLPVTEAFGIAAALEADAQGNARAILTNTGSRSLIGVTASLALPEGWRASGVQEGAQIVRMAAGDYLLIDDISLAPGGEMSLSVTLSAFAAQGQGTLYIENIAASQATGDNPQGMLFPQAEEVMEPAARQGGFAAFSYGAAAQGTLVGETLQVIRGRMYEDKNGSGTRDAGETGEEGLCVQSLAGSVILRAYTDAEGAFVLPAHEGQQLEFALPAHMMAGQVNDKMEIPYTVSCMIHGQVTASGMPLEGVRVTADGQSAVTDNQGYYRLNRLTAGTYDVTFELAGTMAQNFTFPQGQHAVVQAVVNEENKEARISAEAVAFGSVTLEAQGLEGLTVHLTQQDQPAASCVFEGGRAAFEKLYPGEYMIRVQLPEELMLATLNGYDYAQRGEALWTVSVIGGQESLYRLEMTALGSLNGTIEWAGSQPLTVTVQGRQEAWSLQTQDAIRFDSLLPGEYSISVLLPEGYMAAPEGAWQMQEGSAVAQVLVEADQTANLEPLALWQAGRIAGRVFHDQNANGAQDGGEAAGGQIPVELYRVTADGARLAQSTVTDDVGVYAFANVMPGEYYLQMAPAFGASFNRIGGSVIGSDGRSLPFMMGDGQQADQMNATLVTPTSLKAVVFWDSSEDGSRGVYERSVEGVTVSVVDEEGRVYAQGVTNSSGTVKLNDLLPGVYRVQFDLPQGYGFSARGEGGPDEGISAIDKQESRSGLSDPITLVQGGEQSIGAGVLKLGFVSGRIWYDTDSNGVMSGGEPGVAGIKVQLIPRKASGTAYELVTNEQGEYFFDGVRSGTYDLTVSVPEGMMFTRYSKTGRENRSIFTSEGERTGKKTLNVESGRTIDQQNIGFVTGGVIEGVVFLDADYDGLYQPGDEMLAGVRVELEKVSTGAAMGEVTVDASGAFCFEALRGGTYRMKAVLPDESYVFTRSLSMTEAGNWFAARSGHRDSTLHSLKLADMGRQTVYIGVVRTGSVSGQIYMDDDFSATRGGREKTVEGLNVFLTDDKGQILERTRSDKDGRYTFEGLVPGYYQVRMEALEGYVFTKPGEGNWVTSLSDEGDGATQTFYLAMGENLGGVDGGLILPGQVKGLIFNDANDNGLQDEGEGGLAGVTVTLIDQMTGQAQFSLVTANDGAYSFNRVMPGSYHVRYDLPQGGSFAFVAEGGNAVTGEGLSAASGIFDFKTAEKKTMPLAGGLILATLEGQFYEDLNGSGAWEEGERFLPGIRLVFNGSEQTTGEDGCFSVTGVRPGSYELMIDGPEGYIFTRNGEAIAPRGSSSYHDTYTASAGQRNSGLMIGMLPEAYLGGYVWMDEDLSASWNDQDSVIAGMPVTLYDRADGMTVYTTQTDENGYFEFRGLVAGSYEAVIQIPEGSIAAQAGSNGFGDNGQGSMTTGVLPLYAGEKQTQMSCGIITYAVLQGRVWQDEAGTALPLAGVTVELADENGSGVFTMTTGEDGLYTFNQVLPGDYVIRATLPQGYLMVEPEDDRLTDGSLVSIMIIENGLQGESELMRVFMAEHEAGLDIGAVKPGMLGDKAWLDENGNGLQETAEAPMPGITVQLLRDGLVIHEAQTDVYGYYLFDNVYPSTYDVHIFWHDEIKPTRMRTDLPLLGSRLAPSEEGSQVIQGVEIKSNVKNFDFDLGFVLREEGVKPEEMVPAPVQVWK